MQTPFEDMVADTKKHHQKLGLIHPKASSQKIQDSVLDIKCTWILMMSNTIPFDFFLIFSLKPLVKPNS